MTILSLDPSSAATGWAIFEDGVISLAGFSESFKPEEYDGDRYRKVYDWLGQILRVVGPDLILVESYFFSKKFATGSDINSEMRAIMKMAIRDLQIPYEIINPTDWKMALLGRVRPTRAEKKKWGKEKAKKIIVVNALEELGLKCPQRIVNPTTKKKVKFKYDVSDAIGILLYHLSKNNIDYAFSSDMWNFEVVE